MVMQWTDRAPLRPDRYLDWELVNRQARKQAGEPLEDCWCSVLLQLWATPGADPAASMKRLLAELSTPPAAGTRTIVASHEERALLEWRISHVDAEPPSGDDDPNFTFFVYMPESRAYTADGAFNHRQDYYRIRLVGPPIPGLQPDQQRPATAMAFREMRSQSRSPVAIGIIDHAIAFANERFRSRVGLAAGAADKTRIKRLWIQSPETAVLGRSGEPLFGRYLDDSAIDAELDRSRKASGSINEDAVYLRSGEIDFSADSRTALAHRLGHGTHVMDLAAGYAPDDEAGDARPILAVQLPEPATLDTSGTTMTSYVLRAVRQIMHWADTIERSGPLPLVINFSYGIYAGPKDGRHLLERELFRLIERRNRNPKSPTALVVPAGNTYLARVTARMRLKTGANEHVYWMIHPDCGTPSHLEIWLDDAGEASPVTVAITPPGATSAMAVSVPSNGQAKVLSRDGNPIAALYFDAVANDATGADGRSRLFLAINPTKSFCAGQPLAPSGAWCIALSNPGNSTVAAHLFIQRQERPPGIEPPGRQSYFEHHLAYGRDNAIGQYDQLATDCPICHEETLTAIATHASTIVVGAAFDKKDGVNRPSRYTSSGPVHGRLAPDFAAVADEDRAYLGVLAAGTRSSSVVALDGTSAAAPQVARALADAGVSVHRLRQNLGVAATARPDPRLGLAVAPKVTRGDIKPRRRT